MSINLDVEYSLKKYILDTNHDIVEKHHNMNLKSFIHIKNNDSEYTNSIDLCGND